MLVEGDAGGGRPVVAMRRLKVGLSICNKCCKCSLSLCSSSTRLLRSSSCSLTRGSTIRRAPTHRAQHGHRNGASTQRARKRCADRTRLQAEGCKHWRTHSH